MNVAFALTLDGMLRALRTKLHGVQDDLQGGDAENKGEGRERALRDRPTQMREERDGNRRS